MGTDLALGCGAQGHRHRLRLSLVDGVRGRAEAHRHTRHVVVVDGDGRLRDAPSRHPRGQGAAEGELDALPVVVLRVIGSREGEGLGGLRGAEGDAGLRERVVVAAGPALVLNLYRDDRVTPRGMAHHHRDGGERAFRHSVGIRTETDGRGPLGRHVLYGDHCLDELPAVVPGGRVSSLKDTFSPGSPIRSETAENSKDFEISPALKMTLVGTPT